jgi:hypothetical protein
MSKVARRKKKEKRERVRNGRTLCYDCTSSSDAREGFNELKKKKKKINQRNSPTRFLRLAVRPLCTENGPIAARDDTKKKKDDFSPLPSFYHVKDTSKTSALRSTSGLLLSIGLLMYC